MDDINFLMKNVLSKLRAIRISFKDAKGISIKTYVSEGDLLQMVINPNFKNKKCTDGYFLQDFLKQMTFKELVGEPNSRNTTASFYLEIALGRAPKIDQPSCSKISYPETLTENFLTLKKRKWIRKIIKIQI